MPGTSDRITLFTESVIREMTRVANQYDAINLSQGFPDFDGPKALLDRVEHYLNSGHNQYAPMMGVPALRAAIKEAVRRAYLDGDSDGPRSYTATSWVVSGRKPTCP